MIFAIGSLTLALFFALLLRALAWLRRMYELPLEVCRKSAHIAMGLTGFALPFFVRGTLEILVLAAIFLSLLALLRWHPHWLGGGGELLPTSRLPAAPSDGEFYFVAGLAATFLFARNDRLLYSTTLLVLTFSDAAAALVGMRFGKHRLWRSDKTLEGSAAFFVTSLCVLVLLGMPLRSPAMWSLILVVTVVESIARRGSDNLAIPLTCIALFQLHRYVGI